MYKENEKDIIDYQLLLLQHTAICDRKNDSSNTAMPISKHSSTEHILGYAPFIFSMSFHDYSKQENTWKNSVY